MSSYVLKTRILKMPRQCDECKTGMDEGYLHDTGGDTYCSSECLDKNYSQFDQLDLLVLGILFWTDWYDEVEVAE